MDDRGKAVHKFEVAVDRVNDATQQADEINPHDGDFKLTPIQVKQEEIYVARAIENVIQSTSGCVNEINDMMKSFKIFDSNKDSTLDIDELGAAFRLMGQNPTQQQLRDVAKEADLDGNGHIDEQEFTRLLIKNMQSTTNVKQEMQQAFAVFDTDGKGKINKKDLINTLQLCGEDPLTDKEAGELMAVMDTNKDGVIDINEFVNFLCKSIPVRYYTVNT